MNDRYILFVQLYVLYVFNLYCIRKNVLSITRSILVFLILVVNFFVIFPVFSVNL